MPDDKEVAALAEERDVEKNARKIWAREFRINPVKRNDETVLVDIECTVETLGGAVRCDNYLIVRAIMPTLPEALAAAVYYIENDMAYAELLPDSLIRDKETGETYRQTTFHDFAMKYINKEPPCPTKQK